MAVQRNDGLLIFFYHSLCHLFWLLDLQKRALEDKIEQERKARKFKVSETEKQLEAVKQDLAVSKSALQAKNAECAALQQNLQELEELREMKQADIKSFLFYYHSIFFFLITLPFYFQSSRGQCFGVLLFSH